MRENVIGLDIGGANLKAARPDGAARLRPFQLWKSPERLGDALQELLMGWQVETLAVTMTGELCDCFETKRDGVRRILAQVEQAFSGIPVRVWSAQGQFVAPAEARSEHLKVAAANWHALATLVGQTWLREAVLAMIIDTGSTTSDIIPMEKGRPVPSGWTDMARLQSGELVYTGVGRTPVCALLSTGIAAEFFASTHDVYLRLGMAPDQADCHDTADGRPATATHAHGRLARMVGGDPEITSEHATHELATMAFVRQRQLLVDAIGRVVSRMTGSPEAVIFSGAGAFLARAAWDAFSATHEGEKARASRLIALADLMTPETSTAACAYAVAKLAVNA